MKNMQIVQPQLVVQLVLFLCSFSFNLFFFLKITTNDKCRCRWCSLLSKIFQCFFKSFSPMVTRLNASKISRSMSLSSLKLSLLSQNIGGCLDVSGSMYIALIALKASFLTLCNSLSSSSSFFLSLLNLASLLFTFSLNCFKALIASF